ncbi:MAG: sulfurtransferase TusA family protein [Bacillota bacterium]|jgi:tRNA 2-thiouridine synthesizing protein A|nr:sulfurtransferase TusA family protein [Clostridia bacterium]
MKEINLYGMSCPEPVLRTQNELKGMKPGEKLMVLVDSETAKENITRLVLSRKHKINVKKESEGFALEIEV